MLQTRYSLEMGKVFNRIYRKMEPEKYTYPNRENARKIIK